MGRTPNRLPDYLGPHIYLLPFLTGSMTLNDSTTYVWAFSTGGYGAGGTPTTANLLYFPNNGKIISCLLTHWSTNVPTNENCSFYVRINGTTDHLLKTSGLTQFNNWLIENLNINIAKGDYAQIKLITPAWATNPTGTRFSGYLFVKCV